MLSGASCPVFPDRAHYTRPVAKKQSKKTSKKAGSKGSRSRKAPAGAGASPPSTDEPPRAPGELARATLETTLDQIIGQDRAVATLRAAMRCERLHHAWIFHGPPGVGKMTTALSFGAVLLDPTTVPNLAGELEPDPDSQVQRLLRAGSHPDLHVIRKELAPFSRETRIRGHKQTVIPTEVLREFLIEPACRSRALAGDSLAGKVMLVDEAHLLNLEGQNALLKTLEEPPPGTVVILVTSNEEKLLPTVRSRCQRVAFGLLDAEAMRAWADRAGVAERFERGELPGWIHEIAPGSPGGVLDALERGLDEWHRTLSPMIADLDGGRYPPEFATTAAQLVSDWAERRVAGRPNASKDAANKAGAGELFRFLATRLRRELGAALDEGRDPTPWLESIDALRDAERQVGSNVQLTFVLEAFASRLADCFGVPDASQA